MTDSLTEVISFANSVPVWILNLLLVSIVFGQALIFMVLGLKSSKEFSISTLEMKRAFRTGIISTIGPAIAVFIVGIGLITQIGAPLTLARLSVMGNAVYEAYAAQEGALAVGTSLGSPDYSMKAFAASAWVMGLGSCLMMVLPLVLTKSISKAKQKVERKRKGIGRIIGVSASLGAFGYATTENLTKGYDFAVAALISFIVMVILSKLSRQKNIQWLSEWSLGISMLLGMVAATIV